MTNMKKHAYNIFPEMQQDDYARLLNDIKTNGYDAKNPIYTYQGEILDGWNRKKACDELGVTPNYREFVGDDAQALDFVMRTNKRRNLNSSQWATIAVEAESLIRMIRDNVEMLRRQKQVENASNQFSEPCNNKLLQPEIRNPNENSTATQVAELFNTNRTYINKATKLKETNPELFAKVKSGEKTMTEAERDIRKEERFEKKVFESKQMPSGVYDLVYCDPPWKYDFAETDNRKIENQYPTMTVDEICQMKLPTLATNALLLMWATAPKLCEALKVIESWGFTYKTHSVWDKVKIGMGYWFRGQHELLIVATRGTYSPPEPEFRESSVYIEERGIHSSKPIHYYEWIEMAFPHAHKIELFSRVNRENWEAWGNE